MQDHRAVAVEYALGITSGARGVAEEGAGIFVELGPSVGIVFGGQQCFIAENAVVLGGAPVGGR